MIPCSAAALPRREKYVSTRTPGDVDRPEGQRTQTLSASLYFGYFCNQTTQCELGFTAKSRLKIEKVRSLNKNNSSQGNSK